MKTLSADDILLAHMKRTKSRITSERFDVLHAAVAYESHFSADELYLAMQNSGKKISRATVYNTLDLLTQARLFTTRNFGDTITRYERSYDKEEHDHILCLDCGRIIEFTHPDIHSIQESVTKELGFSTVHYSLDIYAYCNNKVECPYYKEHHRKSLDETV